MQVGLFFLILLQKEAWLDGSYFYKSQLVDVIFLDLVDPFGKFE